MEQYQYLHDTVVAETSDCQTIKYHPFIPVPKQPTDRSYLDKGYLFDDVLSVNPAFGFRAFKPGHSLFLGENGFQDDLFERLSPSQPRKM